MTTREEVQAKLNEVADVLGDLAATLGPVETVVIAAHEYVRAIIERHEATGRAATEAQLRCDSALHDLVLAFAYPCVYCDAGTCPGAFATVTDTRPL